MNSFRLKFLNLFQLPALWVCEEHDDILFYYIFFSVGCAADQSSKKFLSFRSISADPPSPPSSSSSSSFRSKRFQLRHLFYFKLFLLHSRRSVSTMLQVLLVAVRPSFISTEQRQTLNSFFHTSLPFTQKKKRRTEKSARFATKNIKQKFT